MHATHFSSRRPSQRLYGVEGTDEHLHQQQSRLMTPDSSVSGWDESESDNSRSFSGRSEILMQKSTLPPISADQIYLREQKLPSIYGRMNSEQRRLPPLHTVVGNAMDYSFRQPSQPVVDGQLQVQEPVLSHPVFKPLSLYPMNRLRADYGTEHSASLNEWTGLASPYTSPAQYASATFSTRQTESGPISRPRDECNHHHTRGYADYVSGKCCKCIRRMSTTSSTEESPYLPNRSFLTKSAETRPYRNDVNNARRNDSMHIKAAMALPRLHTSYRVDGRGGSSHNDRTLPRTYPHSTNSRKRSNLPRQATELMKHWFNENLPNPYPSEEQKVMFANATGIDLKQVNHWFINHRRRCPEHRDNREKNRDREALR